MDASAPSKGIFDSANLDAREHVVELLCKAYWMEIETVMSYLAASVNLDGVRAQEIKESLAEDVEEGLGHAKQFAERIKELYGVVPGSEEFAAEQSFLQPPDEQTDIVHVIRGVIKAETGAIEHYTRIAARRGGGGRAAGARAHDHTPARRRPVGADGAALRARGDPAARWLVGRRAGEGGGGGRGRPPPPPPPAVSST